MRIDKDRCFRKNDHILYKEIDGAGVLVDPYRRTLVHLNPTASQIWQLLDEAHSCTAIIKKLQAEFEVGDKELEKDVSDVFNELFKREMIQ